MDFANVGTSLHQPRRSWCWVSAEGLLGKSFHYIKGCVEIESAFTGGIPKDPSVPLAL